MPPLRFADIELSATERAVRVRGQPVALGARAFDLLMALVDRRDRVVSKNELLDIVWPGLVVEENNLSVQISTLRKALGNGSIATIPGRGYRFIAATATGHVDQAEPLHGVRRVSRRLAAVVVCALCHRSHVDGDAGTLAEADARQAQLWHRLRGELIETSIAAAGGRAVELLAEEMLLEFASAVDAVRWGFALLYDLASRDDGGRGTLSARIGVAVDDVVVEDLRLIGDAVGHARLAQAAAAPGELVLTASARLLVSERLALVERALPPVQAGGSTLTLTAVTPPVPATTPGSTRRPRVHAPGLAVMPFDAEPGDDYFGDGITEEIITALAANRSLHVISRQSTLHYRHQQSSLSQVATELGVRYLLRGSVRRAGAQVRIGAELVEVASGRTLWADRYVGEGNDLFRIQATIAASLSAAVDPWVRHAEVARVATRPPPQLDAYDSVLRGLSVLHTFEGADFALAGECFRRAIALDPRYAQAHAYLAWWHNLNFGEGRSSDWDEDRRAAQALSRRAVELDPRDALSLSVAGHIQSFTQHRFDEAMAMFDQAIEADPNCAPAWSRSATTLAYMGRGDEAMERVEHALRLSPFDPMRFATYTTAGTASLVRGRYDEAVAWAGKARALNPGYRAIRRLMVAALALVGEVGEARELAAQLLAEAPGFRVGDFARSYPLRQPHLGRMVEGMRIAGLPD